jgi:lambda family phage portal protein
MSLLGRILSRITGSKATAKAPKPIRGSYDAASTDPANADHWLNADHYNANAANSPSVRELLRERSRYEDQNNGYCGGLIDSIANDVIGTGPRPQITIPGDEDREWSRQVEALWQRWSEAINFAEDLRLMQRATVADGESFAVLVSNEGVVNDRNSISLDLQLYETDQVSDPWDWGIDPLYSDGVRYDRLANPVEYTFREQHPGGVAGWRSWDTVTIPADWVIHWYKPKRIGQHRGIPWLTAALPLFAQLRRYTLATLSAAELAAMLAGIMKTDGTGGEGPVSVEAMDAINLVRGALLTLPAGWSAEQFEAKQPVSTYKDFKGEILNEVGRGTGTPFNVMAGNSSGYNYSSGRLDHQIYQSAVKIERSRCSSVVLARVFWRWCEEAYKVHRMQSVGVPPPHTWGVKWFFDGFGSIDPQKDAMTNKLNLESGATNLATVYAERGEDWQDALAQRTAELMYQDQMSRRRKAGKPQPQTPAETQAAQPANAQPGSQQDAAEQGNVQDAALNGAQIASLLQIIDRVSSGELPPEAAAAIMRAAFPLMSAETIQAIVDALKVPS